MRFWTRVLSHPTQRTKQDSAPDPESRGVTATGRPSTGEGGCPPHALPCRAPPPHLFLGQFHKPKDSLQVWLVDEGTHPGTFQKGVSDLYPLGLFHHLLCELIEDFLLHKHPCAVAANLENRHSGSVCGDGNRKGPRGAA